MVVAVTRMVFVLLASNGMYPCLATRLCPSPYSSPRAPLAGRDPPDMLTRLAPLNREAEGQGALGQCQNAPNVRGDTVLKAV